MARKYKKRNGRRGVLTISRRQAATKALDSKVERIMARVADQRIRRAHPSRCSRKYWLQLYDPGTNLFVDMPPLAGGDFPCQVNWGGRVMNCSNLESIDVEFVNNIQPPADPLYASGPAVPQGGLGTGMITASAEDTRFTEKIFVTGVEAQIKVLLLRSDPAHAALITNLAGETHIRYGFYTWRADQALMTNPQSEPSVHQLVKWRGFGYSASLDVAEEVDTNSQQVRCLAKGRTVVRYSTAAAVEKIITIRKSFDPPLRLSYKPGDQHGLPQNQRIYFAIQSSRSTVGGGGPLEENVPRCAIVTKMYWRESL